MTDFRVALLQLRSRGPDLGAAVRDGEAACREAAAMGADLALFPEMWSMGYAPAPHDTFSRVEWTQLAVPSDGEYVSHFAALARELDMAIALTYLERHDPLPRNTATVLDRRGEAVLTYAKVHTCDFGMEDALTPGTDFPVATLELASGAQVRIGVMICFDREFPEAARELMLGGAEVILTPNSCILDSERIGQFRARAFENMVGVAMANYATPLVIPHDNPGIPNGHSVAFSGICYREDGWPHDQLLLLAGEQEAVHIAAFDLDALRAYRRREPWGDAYRKPATYGTLLRDAPDPAFRRRDSRRRPLP